MSKGSLAGYQSKVTQGKGWNDSKNALELKRPHRPKIGLGAANALFQ
jgi:hypothetical protein